MGAAVGRRGGKWGWEGWEETRLLEEVAHVLDFDLLCATVALQTQGFSVDKRGSGDVGEDEDELAVEVEGVQRMWEGGVFDCLQDRQIAIETSCLPCYRFGKNMSRANLGSCFFQGAVYLFLTVAILFNAVAFMITLWHGFLYLGIVSVTSAAIYLGYSRGRIRKQFNIRARDSALDDCVSHLVCLAVLCESRTLEMNNVQDGVWHGRSDTICIGSKTFRNSANPPLSPSNPPSSATWRGRQTRVAILGVQTPAACLPPL
ncbi:unnamed protein product [Spirodela intermedia]|uniref:Uncharacterized protein n=1 Tax=Spirodela intermedia TaxID=51605 RepID=A0ABN7EAU4_SPIIN|nr:unnamed protein product [Spirodela intermedia]